MIPKPPPLPAGEGGAAGGALSTCEDPPAAAGMVSAKPQQEHRGLQKT